MTSSNLNVGTRMYIKRRTHNPKVDNKGGIDVTNIVKNMLKDIEMNGENAVLKYSEKFDKYTGNILVTNEQLIEATNKLSIKVKSDIRFAHHKIKQFAEAQRSSMNNLEIELDKGYITGHKLVPVNCVGCYIPGGRYAHIASALMTVTTAKAAGCSYIIACSPARGDTIHPGVLYALNLAGATYILTLGGVQALASLSYGLFTPQHIPKVDMIVGPGNRFVVEAKKQLYGKVGIDLIAGPTEACVIADNTADPYIIATDLISQAEHGYDSPCVLVTTDLQIAKKVDKIIHEIINNLPKQARDVSKISWNDYGEIIYVQTKEEMCRVSDEIASEHLEVHCKDLDWYHNKLKNYGSLFLGDKTCISFGDKASGPNHVLPTIGASRWTGGLWVGMFIKTLSYQKSISNDNKSMLDIANVTASISRSEGMEAHARSADIRMKKYANSKYIASKL